MATNVALEVEVKDVEYQRIDGRPWLARIYQPQATGPFPTVVDVHGGAWHNGDRTNDTVMNTCMASQGVLTIAIDFRQPPEAGYPASVQDLNLAIRWAKAHAAEYGGKHTIGAIGVSSGGHLVELAGMRPRDARYSALPLPGHADLDASLAYVIPMWPVSDPLFAYHVAQQDGRPELVEAHDMYWATEAAMSEGSPPLILERGEAVDLPPMLIINRRVDTRHPLEMQQRLQSWYRKRGGSLDIEVYDNLPPRFQLTPEYPDTQRAMDVVIDFIKKHG